MEIILCRYVLPSRKLCLKEKNSLLEKLRWSLRRNVCKKNIRFLRCKVFLCHFSSLLAGKSDSLLLSHRLVGLPSLVISYLTSLFFPWDFGAKGSTIRTEGRELYMILINPFILFENIFYIVNVSLIPQIHDYTLKWAITTQCH